MDPEFEPILNRRGSEEGVYAFLQAEFDQINLKAFDGGLSRPNFQIKPVWLSKGLFGERNSAADYEPAEGNQPAEIGLFTAILVDEDEVCGALAHEMVHHWEHTLATTRAWNILPRSIKKSVSGFLTQSVRLDGVGDIPSDLYLEHVLSHKCSVFRLGSCCFEGDRFPLKFL